MQSSRALTTPFGLARRGFAGSTVLGLGTATLYLSLVVLIPLAAIVWNSTDQGLNGFWQTVTSPQAFAAIRFTFLVALAVMAVNAVFGTLIAWVLVRDRFRGQSLVNSVIDLPFALPTIVAGLTLLALYGPKGPLGINIAYTQLAVLAAVAFVTFPFVVRAVQPVLLELDRDMEDAAASLGASKLSIFRRIILPNLRPAILTGAGLSFAKALGEIGSVVLISGNIPFKTQVASVYIFGQIESDNVSGAAAVSVVLLILALLVLFLINLLRRRSARR